MVSVGGYMTVASGDLQIAAKQHLERCEWAFPVFGDVCRRREDFVRVCERFLESRAWRATSRQGPASPRLRAP
jgi:hypothetical protein